MTRRALTLSAKVEAMEANALCPKCFRPFAGNVEYDHEIPLGIGGKDHDETALVPLCRKCHSDKTKADVKRIAKCRRQAGVTGQQARRKKNGSKLKSRGFEKSLSKKFSGEIIRKGQ